MRILGLVVLVSLLATLGLLACVPVTLTPGVPAATATPTPAIYGAWTPVPTPAMPTPPPGATPVSSTTKEYMSRPIYFFGPPTDTIDVKKGDIVVITVKLVTGGGAGVTVSVDDPPGTSPASPVISVVGLQYGGSGTGKLSFRAAVDGAHRLLVDNQMGESNQRVSVTIDIYR